MIFVFDIAKLIMSIIIIAVHTNPLNSISEVSNFYLVNTLGRIPVPIFFAIAGYLLYSKLKKQPNNYKKIVKSYLKRISIIYIIWSVIYFIPYMHTNPSLLRVIKFIPRLLTKGVYSQLWYMQALIVGVFLSTYLNKKIGLKKTLIVSLILYAIGLIIVPYFSLVSRIITIPNIINKIILKEGYKVGRNGLFFGMFFITLGGYISSNYKVANNKKYIVGLILSVISLLIETTMIKKIGGQYWALQISLIPLSYNLLILMLNINETSNKQCNTKKIRIMSFLIYLIHEWIHFAYSILIEKSIVPEFLKNSLVAYIVIAIVTIFLSELIINLSNKPKFKYLKILY